MSSPKGSPKDDEDDASDVELEGMDMEGIEEEDTPNDEPENEAMEDAPAVSTEEDAADVTARQKDDAEELEAAKRERMELLAAEQKKVAKGGDVAALDPQTRFADLLNQSDVFAHFLAGSVAASTKKGKKSRGKAGRMTEAEEDAQMLKSAQSKRRTIRLDKQPGIIGKEYTLHKYQLEGLNWMIKLHDSGINGILADEVRVVFKFSSSQVLRQH